MHYSLASLSWVRIYTNKRGIKQGKNTSQKRKDFQEVPNRDVEEDITAKNFMVGTFNYT